MDTFGNVVIIWIGGHYTQHAMRDDDASGLGNYANHPLQASVVPREAIPQDLGGLRDYCRGNDEFIASVDCRIPHNGIASFRVGECRDVDVGIKDCAKKFVAVRESHGSRAECRLL